MPQRPLPEADHRDPAGGRTRVLSWVGRTVSPIGREQFLVSVPCLCRSFERGIDAAFTASLRRRWLPEPVGSWSITFVVAAFDYPPQGFDRLLLALTATPLGHPDMPLDSQRMGRDLELTLDRYHRARLAAAREPERSPRPS